MCCEPYSDEVDGRRSIRMEVKDAKVLSTLGVGNRASFHVQGDISEVIAPKKVTDYDAAWDYEKDRKAGKKRPTKIEPGKVVILMDKADPDIVVLNNHLMDEEDD
jgi:hypothetical protein